MLDFCLNLRPIELSDKTGTDIFVRLFSYISSNISFQVPL
jgi:hypothetical protein